VGGALTGAARTPRILAVSSPGEVRVAAVDGDGVLLDYAIWRPGAPDGVGDLYRGRVTARMPALAGCFVLLDGADGFLPDSEGGRDASQGTVLGVRVTRAAQGGKGPRLTARLTATEQATVGGGAPALLARGPSAVERLASLHPDAAILTDDGSLTALLRPRLGDRLATRAQVLDDALADAIDVLGSPEVALPGGGRLLIQPTAALVAIDLDSGAASAGRQGKAAAQFGFNRAALPVLARQIQLRSLSGAILVDFAGLAARRRPALAPELATALAQDPGGARLLGFTALGLAEIVRPRVHPPLHELLAGPHAAGLAALRQAARDVGPEHAPALRPPALRASPAIVAALQADPVALPDLVRRTGRSLMLRSDPALPRDAWVLE